ncbi:hypothetical protein ELAC_1462 [Estrella lausannensis]|uniref:Uncharacterized protein n=1 Tax=Estrella lausannensis TaxID=483423 RepID=A0A0H5DRH5_9BACT|nr:hypothetical protein ELAC_1462 [Estrella lausannensis]
MSYPPQFPSHQNLSGGIEELFLISAPLLLSENHPLGRENLLPDLRCLSRNKKARMLDFDRLSAYILEFWYSLLETFYKLNSYDLFAELGDIPKVSQNLEF